MQIEQEYDIIDLSSSIYCKYKIIRRRKNLKELFIEEIIVKSMNFLDNNQRILNKFISSKELEGCSTRTLNY